MIKIASPASNTFQRFKCGEIFCISPAVYNVTCCRCAVEIHLDQFACHFQMQHLALVEESINLEILECNETEKLMNDDSIESVHVKEEDPADDPIKPEDLPVCCDKDNESVKKLLKKPKKTKRKLKNSKRIPLIEPEVNDLNNGAKSEAEDLVKKSNTKSSKRSKIKKELKDPDEDILVEKTSKIENKDEHSEDFGNCETEMDRDWLQEDEASKTESESGNDNIKDELPYPCHTCKRSYRSKHGLQTHNKIAHNPNKKATRKRKEPNVEHKCDQCHEVCRTARDLRVHMWKHTGVFCDICGKPFTQGGNMLRHRQRHTGIRDHKCKDCGKAFFTDKELKSHIICHTGLMPAICEICGKQCRHKGVLTAHMRRHTGERPAKCDVCGKCFYSIHDLNVHAVAHTSDRPFRCDICGSTFQRRKALRVHKLIHSKDRKHVCKICGKGFAQASGLKSHMRSHNTALGNSTVEPAQQPVPPNMLENSSSQVEICSSGITTSTSNMDNSGVDILAESGMLEQYMN